MASCVVETRPCRTLVYFKLAVFTEVSTSAVAVKISARVNTDAMLAAVGCSAVVNTVFTVIAVETQLTRTGVIWNQIWAHAIIFTRIGFAVVNVFLALQTCKSIGADTNEAINLRNNNDDNSDEISLGQRKHGGPDGIRTYARLDTGHAL